MNPLKLRKKDAVNNPEKRTPTMIILSNPNKKYVFLSEKYKTIKLTILAIPSLTPGIGMKLGRQFSM